MFAYRMRQNRNSSSNSSSATDAAAQETDLGGGFIGALVLVRMVYERLSSIVRVKVDMTPRASVRRRKQT